MKVGIYFNRTLVRERLLVKARLGKSVYVDMQRFRDENEEQVARLWRHVARNSQDQSAQIAALQAAIEALRVYAYSLYSINKILLNTLTQNIFLCNLFRNLQQIL